MEQKKGAFLVREVEMCEKGVLFGEVSSGPCCPYRGVIL